MYRRKPAVKLEPGTDEWIAKNTAKLHALIKNSHTGNTFMQHFENDKEYLPQQSLDDLLITAIADDNERIVTALLEQGANPNISMYHSMFPKPIEDRETYCVHWACAMGYEGVGRVLIDYGADPKQMDDDGKTAFDYCEGDMQVRMVNYAQSKDMLDRQRDAEYSMFDYEI